MSAAESIERQKRELARRSDRFDREDYVFNRATGQLQVREAAIQREREREKAEFAEEFDQFGIEDIEAVDGELRIKPAAISRERQRQKEQFAAQFEEFSVGDVVIEDGQLRIKQSAIDRERAEQRADFAGRFEEFTVEDVVEEDGQLSISEAAQKREAREQAAAQFGGAFAPEDFVVEETGEGFAASLKEELASDPEAAFRARIAQEYPGNEPQTAIVDRGEDFLVARVTTDEGTETVPVATTRAGRKRAAASLLEEETGVPLNPEDIELQDGQATVGEISLTETAFNLIDEEFDDVDTKQVLARRGDDAITVGIDLDGEEGYEDVQTFRRGQIRAQLAGRLDEYNERLEEAREDAEAEAASDAREEIASDIEADLREQLSGSDLIDAGAIDIRPEDVDLERTDKGFTGELSPSAVADLETMQREAAREQFEQQVEERYNVDIAPEDIELVETDAGLEGRLSESAQEAIGSEIDERLGIIGGAGTGTGVGGVPGVDDSARTVDDVIGEFGQELGIGTAVDIDQPSIEERLGEFGQELGIGTIIDPPQAVETDVPQATDRATVTRTGTEEEIATALERQLGAQKAELLGFNNPALRREVIEETDLTPGEDFTVTTTLTADGVTVEPELTESFRRGFVTDIAERQLEQRTGAETDIDPESDLRLVVEEGGQFRPELTEEGRTKLATESLTEFVADVERETGVESPIEGPIARRLGESRFVDIPIFIGPRTAEGARAPSQAGPAESAVRLETVVQGFEEDALATIERAPEIGQGIEDVTGLDVARDRPGWEQKAAQGIIATPVLIGTGSALLPQKVAEIGATGVQAAREDELGEFGRDVGQAGVNLAARGAAGVIERPAFTAGMLAASLPFSAAVMSRFPSTRWLIQPGEEVAGRGGFAVTRRIAGESTAQRFFPYKEPLIFSEEAALRAARNIGVADRPRAAIEGVRDRVPTVERPSTTGLVDRVSPSGVGFELDPDAGLLEFARRPRVTPTGETRADLGLPIRQTIDRPSRTGFLDRFRTEAAGREQLGRPLPATIDEPAFTERAFEFIERRRQPRPLPTGRRTDLGRPLPTDLDEDGPGTRAIEALQTEPAGREQLGRPLPATIGETAISPRLIDFLDREGILRSPTGEARADLGRPLSTDLGEAGPGTRLLERLRTEPGGRAQLGSPLPASIDETELSTRTFARLTFDRERGPLGETRVDLGRPLSTDLGEAGPGTRLLRALQTEPAGRGQLGRPLPADLGVDAISTRITGRLGGVRRRGPLGEARTDLGRPLPLDLGETPISQRAIEGFQGLRFELATDPLGREQLGRPLPADLGVDAISSRLLGRFESPTGATPTGETRADLGLPIASTIETMTPGEFLDAATFRIGSFEVEAEPVEILATEAETEPETERDVEAFETEVGGEGSQAALIETEAETEPDTRRTGTGRDPLVEAIEPAVDTRAGEDALADRLGGGLGENVADRLQPVAIDAEEATAPALEGASGGLPLALSERLNISAEEILDVESEVEAEAAGSGIGAFEIGRIESLAELELEQEQEAELELETEVETALELAPAPEGESEQQGGGLPRWSPGPAWDLDDRLDVGWLTETISAFAGVEATRPSQEDLEEQPLGFALTGELATVELLEGTEEEQEDLADVQELLGIR